MNARAPCHCPALPFAPPFLSPLACAHTEHMPEHLLRARAIPRPHAPRQACACNTRRACREPGVLNGQSADIRPLCAFAHSSRMSAELAAARPWAAAAQAAAQPPQRSGAMLRCRTSSVPRTRRLDGRSVSQFLSFELRASLESLFAEL